ncbi:hypothetical protein [Celeribacter persicus]|jgi:hypothetical protein|uniref:Uncharacterized protein n=1 Tax=Celeribacter persicus TaxID=1651082 RepID=A0A2T5HWS9_9RHOB|nr:hypothetical protein [Celeribacter persicus]PTQ76040.1 hypothetical protein C8N42_101586 [Celeribacter persicus]
MDAFIKALQDWMANLMASIPAFDLSVFDMSESGERWVRSHSRWHGWPPSDFESNLHKY